MSVKQRVFCIVVMVAVGAGGLGLSDVAQATDGFESGTCVVDVGVSLTGHTLNLDTDANGTCVTNGGLGEAAFDAAVPGLVGFDCDSGVLKGAGANGSGFFTVMVDGDVFLSTPNMLVVATSDGTVLDLAFEWKNASQVVVGNGSFALSPESDMPCAESPVTTWTGAITFVDPAVPGP